VASLCSNIGLQLHQSCPMGATERCQLTIVATEHFASAQIRNKIGALPLPLPRKRERSSIATERHHTLHQRKKTTKVRRIT